MPPKMQNNRLDRCCSCSFSNTFQIHSFVVSSLDTKPAVLSSEINACQVLHNPMYVQPPFSTAVTF